MKIGTVTTLYFYDAEGHDLHAEVEYVGKTKKDEYRFKSVIYGWMYLVSQDLQTVTDYNGEKYKANTERAWAYCIGNS